jgi:hypothetical protein
MKPHSIQTANLHNRLTPSQKKEKEAALGPIAARYGSIHKGAALPASQVSACPRVKVADLPEGHLKQTHIEAMEHNQKIASCCRHPENHDVEALKSHPAEPVPDIYVFHCKCGKKHRFFCLGSTDSRPMWDAS